VSKALRVFSSSNPRGQLCNAGSIHPPWILVDRRTTQPIWPSNAQNGKWQRVAWKNSSGPSAFVASERQPKPLVTAVQPLEVRLVPSFLGQASAEEVEVAVASAVASAEDSAEDSVVVEVVVVAAVVEEVVEVQVPEGPTIRVASADRVGNSDYRNWCFNASLSQKFVVDHRSRIMYIEPK
jgi:hypothetical protein